MEISYLGANCIRINGKAVSVLVDPYSKKNGMPELKMKNDATILTQQGGSELPAQRGVVVDGPGEYEVSGSAIIGAPAKLHIDESGTRGTVYRIEVDGIAIGVLGCIGPELTSGQIEALGQIDVLVIPVGNHGLVFDAQGASNVISQLEPKYVVPTHYDDGTTVYEVPQDKVDIFLKELGTSPEPVSKLKVSSKDLPLETTVVMLQRSGS